MTSFYPDTVISKDNYSEQQVFAKLKKDLEDKNCIVIHSYTVFNTSIERKAKKTLKRRLEADFIVFVPNKGVCVIEVKGGDGIAFNSKDNTWTYSSKNHEPIIKKESPFNQAETLRYHLSDSFKKKHSIKFPQITTLVIMTNFEKGKLPDVSEIPKNKIFDKNDMANSNLFKRIEKTFIEDGYPENKSYDIDSIKILSQSLRSSFCTHINQNYKKEHKAMKYKLEHLTHDQYSCISSGILSEDNYVFVGPAGTGKTLLAKLFLKDSLRNNEKVLYVTKNRLLASELDFEINSFCAEEDISNSNYEVLTIDKIIKNLPEVPSILSDELNLILMDEAQDILNDSYMESFTSLIPKNSRLMFFGDFENQAINQDNNWQQTKLVLNQNNIIYERRDLTANCRNNISVVDEMRKNECYPNHNHIIWQNPNPFFNSKIIKKINFEDSSWKKVLQETLKTIVEKIKIPCNDVVILSTSNKSKDDLTQNLSGSILSKYNFIDYSKTSKITSDSIRCSIVHSFKGLESDYIILLADFIDSHLPKETYLKRLLYTGISRASMGCEVLLSKEFDI